MATTSSNINIEIPDVGETVVTAAAELVTAFEVIDSHDHTDGNGVKITTAAINIDAALDLNSNYLKSANSVELDNLVSTISGALNARRLYVTGGELYYTDSGGTAVKLTSGGAVDITGTGGWTGDYVAVTDAEAKYTDATKVFSLLQNEGTNQAGILDTGDIKLRSTVAGMAFYATVKSPTLSASWTLTLPTEAPASTSVATIDSSGVMATSRDLSIDTLTVSSDLTTASGVDITLQGTGELNHGEIVLVIPASAASGAVAANFISFNGYSVGSDMDIPLVLKEGDVIVGAKLYFWGSGSGTKRLVIQKISSTTGTITELGVGSDTNTGFNYINVTLVTSETVALGSTYYIRFDTSTTTDRFYGIELTYSHA